MKNIFYNNNFFNSEWFSSLKSTILEVLTRILQDERIILLVGLLVFLEFISSLSEQLIKNLRYFFIPLKLRNSLTKALPYIIWTFRGVLMYSLFLRVYELTP